MPRGVVVYNFRDKDIDLSKIVPIPGKVIRVSEAASTHREIDIQREILRWAKARGYACGKIKVQGMKQPDGTYYKDRLAFRGLSDLLMFTPALVFIEVKGPNGRLRPDQIEFQKMCHKAGIKYIVAKSVEDVIRGL